MRGDAGKPAVFHDDQICAGLDGELTGRFGGADHSSHRGTQIGVFGFLDVFHVAVAPVEQAAQKVGWDVCLLYDFGMRWILLVFLVLTGSLLRADEFSDTLKKAEQGNADAQVNLGMSYEKGEGVIRDFKEALKWYRKAADQGNADGQYRVGVLYHVGLGAPKDKGEALKWYRKAADQGKAAAQTGLGISYLKGEGVPKDTAEALNWFRKAANQGDADAQVRLGITYLNGDGVPKDKGEALKWFRKASDQGNADGQLFAGLMYSTGDGVPRNYVKSYVWLSIAAANGSEKAQSTLLDLEARMTPDQIAEAQREAERLFEEMKRK